MLYCDPAFFTFSMIDQKDFCIALGRWAAVIDQFLPLALIKWGYSLKSVLIGFSLSFILVYYACFLVIQHILKQPVYSILLILSLCLTFRLTFYYPTAELYTGMAFGALFGALLNSILEKHATLKIYHQALLLTIAVVLSYFHQLTVLLLIFLILFEGISRNILFRKDFVILLCLTAGWLIIRMKFLTGSTYEKDKMVSSGVFFQEMFNLKNNPTFQYFIHFCKNDIIVPLIFFLITLIMLFRNNIKLAFFILAYTIMFVLLVIITLYRGESAIMTENYFSVFGLFIASPLLLLLQNGNRKILIALLPCLVVYSLIEIYKSSSQLTRRVGIVENMIDYGRQFPERKFIIEDESLAHFHLLSIWSLPFESALQSALRGPGYDVSYFIKKPGMVLEPEKLAKKGVFLGPDWEPFWFTTPSLHPVYFNLPDAPYLDLSTNQDELINADTIFNLKGISLEAQRRVINVGEIQTVKITNHSPFVLASIPGKKSATFISYHLLDADGNTVKWDNPRTRLLLDVHPQKSLIQEVFIEQPEKKGNYIIQIDLVTEGIRWWGINASFKLNAN